MSSQFDLTDPENEALLGSCRQAKRIAVLTGAGISAESGLATFRGDGGIWSKFKPEELANMEAFLRNPERVWEWYQYRRDVLDSANPNPGHFALAAWERICPEFSLITQNVDGLHQAAGSTRVIELHGNLKVNRCQSCGAESDTEEIRFEGKVPKCGCGGMLRPGVVWFGEMLPEAAIREAFQSSQTCDLFLVVGTSAVVYPAASLPEIAKESGAAVLEINPEPTPITRWADFSIRGNAGDILPQLVEAISIKL
ncbi:NAD-dependent deacylase [bacterium]|nr:NAD-dependent deacylase [bacterium]MBU1638040.1 NAD-dependent deacylase [bacterium]MBU1919305.1 NAD-dependent deacylase [bacterium]